eukprot:Clim_evm54s147 gene=Clim_evmTU54s147
MVPRNSRHSHDHHDRDQEASDGLLYQEDDFEFQGLGQLHSDRSDDASEIDDDSDFWPEPEYYLGVFDKSLPWRAIIVVFLIQTAEAFQIALILPYVPFMVASFKGVEEKWVGIWSGLIGASFPMGQSVSAVAWGMISDRFGARNTLMVCMFFTGILSFLFGTTQAPWQAMACRFATGLLNGNIGVVKGYLARHSTPENQKTVMSFTSVAWNLGASVAPLVGGMLADPVSKYPGVFKPDGWFGDPYRYLLPSIVTVGVTYISMPVVFFMIDEEPPHRLSMLRASGISTTSNDSTDIPFEEHKKNNGADLIARKWKALDKKPLYMSCLLYGFIAAQSIGTMETIPLFFRAGVDKAGLGFNSSSTGLVFSIMSVWVCIFSVAFYPRINARLANRTSSMCILFMVILFLFMPLAHDVTIKAGGLKQTGPSGPSEVPIPTLTYVTFMSMYRGCVTIVSFTGVMVMINNSVPRELLGRANGLGQMAASTARSFGPTTAGLVWSLTAGSDACDAGNFWNIYRWVPWLLLCFAAVCTFFVAYSVPVSVEHPYEEGYETIPMEVDDEDRRGMRLSTSSQLA